MYLIDIRETKYSGKEIFPARRKFPYGNLIQAFFHVLFRQPHAETLPQRRAEHFLCMKVIWNITATEVPNYTI
jgi:hypothetical protein